MSRNIQPVKPHRSGWCFKLPVSEWTQEEHDKCPKNFSSSTCECPCEHKGERSLESRNMTYQPFVPPKTLKVTTTEEDDDD